MSRAGASLHLFEGYGIELEYMIVDRISLDVLPVSDKVLARVAHEFTNEADMGRLAWSNEIVLHVIELKTNGPVQSFEDLPELFRQDIGHINTILEPTGGLLMPTGMHPWMDPRTKTKLWPHENEIIYTSYDRIFGTGGHGWSNLQSMHLNLPFQGDEEFVRLHAAIRLVLPLLPALAASTPIVGGSATPLKDNRLEAYRHNQEKIPSITGLIIPEAVRSIDEYRSLILEPMYRDIAPYDPGGVLQHEWLNSRGAIPRFERNTIEIRVIDVQECPLADIAVASFVSSVVKSLVAEKWSGLEDQMAIPTEDLSDIFLGTVRLAEGYEVDGHAYAPLFGIQPGMQRPAAGTVWKHLLESCMDLSSWEYPVLETMLSHGSLSTRILKQLGSGFSKNGLKALYGKLCRSLSRNELFIP